MILNRKIDIYVKRDGILDENLQKAYYLIHGQCTELLKSKLKKSANWETVSSQYNLLGLLEAIKTIIYKFKDQKYVPLSLHHAKRNFYAFCQGNLPYPDYLDRFMNLVDMAESYNAKLYDQRCSKWHKILQSTARLQKPIYKMKNKKLLKIQHERFISHVHSSSIPTSGDTDV